MKVNRTKSPDFPRVSSQTSVWPRQGGFWSAFIQPDKKPPLLVKLVK
jgi:hypothetical protein